MSKYTWEIMVALAFAWLVFGLLFDPLGLRG